MANVRAVGSGTLSMFVGIDIAKQSLTCSLLETPQKLHFFGETVVNAETGFKQLVKRVEHFAAPARCQFITENTGVYGERLYYFCHRHNLPVYREPAHYIRRAFRLKRKTDNVDSRLIAEYGYRYSDQLHRWTPPDPLLEQLQVLMVNRELYQRELSAHHNIVKALGEKERADLMHSHNDARTFFNQQTKQLERQMADLLKTNAEWAQQCVNLDTIPGVGLLYAINFLILTEGFQHVDYRSLAGYLGICPYEFESGASVYKKPRSDKHGPDRMRKQLYISVMAALSCKEANPLKSYFQRKRAEGKIGKIVMNNLENKLLRLSCAVVMGRKPYDKNFKSCRKNL
jgi:transposase